MAPLTQPVQPLSAAVLAVALAALGAWWLGPGPFGPDGPGALAATVLGGHPYPLHPLLIRAAGDPRVLSVISAGVLAGCVSVLAGRLHDSAASAGVLAACAPLLLLPACTAGGDAAAAAVAVAGWCVAWSGPQVWRAALGGVLAGLAVGIKPTALPLMGPLLLTPLVTGRSGWAAPIAVVAGLLPVLSGLDPLLQPQPRKGLLGSWFLATDGALPTAGEWPGLVWAGIRRLWALPTWTGHPVLGGLALAGAVWPGPKRGARLALAALGALGLVAVASLLGDRLEPRYLAAASVPLVVLAARPLQRAPWLALVFLWPAGAVISQLSALRAAEEALPQRPQLAWVQDVDVTPLYLESSVCGAGELRALAQGLTELPPGATVSVPKLRDGRQGELVWPLRMARPDLRIQVDPGHAVVPGVRVGIADASGCATPVQDAAERDAGPWRAPGDGVYGVQR